MDFAFASAPIVKSETQDDGTVYVTGRVADSGLDHDQQICDPEWLDRAVPTWMTEGANIRGQHNAHDAVGVGLQHWKGDDGGHMVRAHIVDPVAVAKVNHKVFKAFSVGIRNPRITTDKSARNGRIVDGTIYEVSLCDRPANPRCVMTVAKADGSNDLQPIETPEVVEIAEAAKADTPPAEEADMTEDQARALFKSLMDEQRVEMVSEITKSLKPSDDNDQDDKITDAASLKAAIAAANSGSDPDASKSKIKAAASRLGLSNLIPDSWSSKVDGPAESDLVKALADLPDAIQNAVTKAVEPLQTGLAEVTQKVNALPAPGGPVVTRTTEQVQKSDTAEKREEYLRKSQDPTLRQDLREGFAALAAQLPG